MTGGAKNNTYVIYLNSNSKLPAAFYFLGYDKLFGSHYDMYYLTYQFVSGSFDDSVFEYYSSKWWGLCDINRCVWVCVGVGVCGCVGVVLSRQLSIEIFPQRISQPSTLVWVTETRA